MKNKYLSIVYVFLFLIVGVFFISMAFAGFKVSECGNSILEENEVCDSGNVSGVSGDYCFSEEGCFAAGKCSPDMTSPSLTHTYVLLDVLGNKTSLGYKGIGSSWNFYSCNGSDCYGGNRSVPNPDYCPDENQTASYFKCEGSQFCIDNAPIGSVMCAPCICKNDFKWVTETNTGRGKCCPKEGNWRYDSATDECMFDVKSKASYSLINLSGTVYVNCSFEGSLDYGGYSDGSVEITSLEGYYYLNSYKQGKENALRGDTSSVYYKKDASRKYSFSGEYLFASYYVTENSPVLFCGVNLVGSVLVDGKVYPIQEAYVSDDIKDIDGDEYISLGQRNSYADCNSPGGSALKCVKFNETVLDCDDWYFDDNSAIRGFSKTCEQGISGFLSALDKEKYCYSDTNNDGVGDFAMCAYCKNPSMTEVADDIDNNCKGSCQGSVSRSCGVINYEGDGMNDLDGDQNCSGVVNSYGIQDNFCQMVDDNVEYNLNPSSDFPSLWVCDGYERAVKYGYKILSEGKNQNSVDPKYCNGQSSCKIDIIELIVFKPAGISLSPLNSYFSPSDFRRLDAMVGNIRVVKNLDNKLTYIEYIDGEGWVNNKLQDFMPQYDFLSLNNAEGYGQITRNTSDLPKQYIDSFRGEFNKKFSDKSIFDKFWNFSKISNKSNFVWLTQCVAKDKCADGGDNDGPKDLYQMEPYKSNLKPITGVEMDGEYSEKKIPLLMNVFDMDDASCKFNLGGEDAMASVYEPVISAALGERSSAGLSNPGDRYIEEIYKKNNFTNQTYCIDKDGDGFCSNSPVFPDCVDKYSDIPKLYSNENVYDSLMFNKNTSSLGAFGELQENLSSWHIHPFFADESLSRSCLMGGQRVVVLEGGVRVSYGLDLNCNKNGQEGYWNEGLYFGSTPFDSDLRTGMEYKDGPVDAVDEDFLYVLENDMACHVPIKTNIKIAYNVLKYIGVASSMYIGGTIVFGSLVPGVLTYLGASPSVIGAVNLGAGAFFSIRGIMATPSAVKGIYTTIIAMDEGTIDSGEGVYQILNNADLVVSSFVIAKSAFNGVGKNSLMAMTTKASIVGKDLKKAVIVAKDNLKGRVVKIPGRNTAEAVDAGAIKTPGCFLENTSVTLANGSLRDIEDIKVGDEVVAFDLENNTSVNSKITSTMVRDETKYRVIEYG